MLPNVHRLAAQPHTITRPNDWITVRICIRIRHMHATMDETAAMRMLTLMQLSDSALPIGRHAHAMGLERLIRDGRVQTRETLREMVVSALIHGAARSDGTATALAHGAVMAQDLAALRGVDARLDLLKQTPSAQAASRRCGSRLAAMATTFGAQALLTEYAAEIAAQKSPGHLSVVSGAIAATAGIDREHAVLCEMRGVASMILSAAVRLDLLASAACQGMLAELSQHIVKATRIALRTGLEEMSCSAAAGIEVAAMRHARDDARLFAS
ncbi:MULTISPECIES: urease accessory protein UreF [unclassified Cupriavidus]|nr:MULTISPECIES: urease accessory UreF family protein [unclassified Cupriavidus]